LNTGYPLRNHNHFRFQHSDILPQLQTAAPDQSLQLGQTKGAEYRNIAKKGPDINAKTLAENSFLFDPIFYDQSAYY
jgi:hypothetical protein